MKWKNSSSYRTLISECSATNFHRSAILARISTCSGRGVLRFSFGFSSGQVSRLLCQQTQNRSITHSARFIRRKIQRERRLLAQRGAPEIHRHFLNSSKENVYRMPNYSYSLCLDRVLNFFRSCNIFWFSPYNIVRRAFFSPCLSKCSLPRPDEIQLTPFNLRGPHVQEDVNPYYASPIQTSNNLRSASNCNSLSQFDALFLSPRFSPAPRIKQRATTHHVGREPTTEAVVEGGWRDAKRDSWVVNGGWRNALEGTEHNSSWLRSL